MLASELRDMDINELKLLCYDAVTGLVTRLEKAEESKAGVNLAYDELAEVSDIWVTQVKVLKETCEKASKSLRILVDFPAKASEVFIKQICEGLFEGLERAKALEE